MIHKIDFAFQCIILTAVASIALLMDRQGLIFILLLQMGTGIYQLIGSAIRTAYRHLYTPKTQKLFRYYWYACVAYATGALFVFGKGTPDVVMISYLLSPWVIAIYYTYISYHLSFPSYQKSHLDI
jgi:hypothetical protein